jgi:outer membrane immunogenic protein
LSWTGFYIGGNLGAVANHSRFTDIDDLFVGFNNTFLDSSETGFTIGGQVGYNWQVSTFVFGLEGDLNWVDSKANVTIRPPAVFASATMDWMSTLRARAGLLLTPTVLLYATGGLAIAHFSDSWGEPTVVTVTSDQTRSAPVVGGGVEYKVTPNVTARLEGLYANFGSTTTATPFVGLSYRTDFAHTAAAVRTGLSFKW